MADAIGAGGIPLAKMTKVYLKIKAERDRLSAEYKEADSELVSQQDKIRSALLGYLKENDLKSVKTDAGTFYRTVKQKYWTSDWENMHKFILEHGVPEFLDPFGKHDAGGDINIQFLKLCGGTQAIGIDVNQGWGVRCARGMFACHHKGRA